MKKFMKLFAIVATMTLFATMLVGCSSSEEEATEEGTVDIGIVLPTKDEPRWVQDADRFEAAIAETDYTCEVMFSQGDSAKEKQNVETLISKGMQVLIICPQDGAAAAATADLAKEAGCTVISYDRLITGTDSVDYYVTFDSFAVGQAQAQYLVDHASGEKGQPLYLYAGAATDENAFTFFAGAWSVLQPYIADGTFVVANSPAANKYKDKAELTRDEQAEIIGEISTDWDFETAKGLAEANLTAAPAEMKGDVLILAPNDGTARSIADVFAADSEITSYVISGQDAEIPSIQYIIDGKQSMTVLKDVRVLVDTTMQLAIDVLEGTDVPTDTVTDNGATEVPTITEEIVVVDQDNVQETIIDSGYYDASEFEGLE